MKITTADVYSMNASFSIMTMMTLITAEMDMANSIVGFNLSYQSKKNDKTNFSKIKLKIKLLYQEQVRLSSMVQIRFEYLNIEI